MPSCPSTAASDMSCSGSCHVEGQSCSSSMPKWGCRDACRADMLAPPVHASTALSELACVSAVSCLTASQHAETHKPLLVLFALEW